jgi:hypothetical protein
MLGIGGHQSAAARTDVWLTPPPVLEPLGEFDLDPCAAIGQPWRTARQQYTLNENGLALPWHGRVWLNPPYGRETGVWLSRMAQHNRGTALIFARTETDMFFEYVWQVASALHFFRGRLHFHFPNGQRAKANAGGPSVLAAYGKADAEILRTCGLPGRFISLSSEVS